MPDITFLITAYNPGDFIVLTLNSILNQSYSKFNILYIDDGSSDNSLSLVEKIIDNRIQIIKNIERIGLIPCLNFGIHLITTKYIIRFDSDDILLPNFLKNKIKNLEKDTILLGENMLITDKNLNIIGKTNFPTSDVLIKKRLIHLKNSINQPGVLLDRESVIKAGCYYPVKAAEDYDLWVRMMKLGKFKNTDSYQLLYRVTGQSLTTSTFEHIAKSNIIALSGYKDAILTKRTTIIYIFLFKQYNYKRGFSFKKIFYYPLFHVYRAFYSRYLIQKSLL